MESLCELPRHVREAEEDHNTRHQAEYHELMTCPNCKVMTSRFVCKLRYDELMRWLQHNTMLRHGTGCGAESRAREWNIHAYKLNGGDDG